MVESTHTQLSVRRQCELLAVNRNRIPEEKPSKAPCFSEEEQRMIRRIDELHLEHPELGARRMSRWLQREGHPANRRLVSRLTKQMGLEAIYRKPRTNIPFLKAKKYPYLLNGMEIMEADKERWSVLQRHSQLACSVEQGRDIPALLGFSAGTDF